APHAAKAGRGRDIPSLISCAEGTSAETSAAAIINLTLCTVPPTPPAPTSDANTVPAAPKLLDRKSTQPATTNAKVIAQPTKVGSGLLSCCQERQTTRPKPCHRPQTTEVQPAPCQNPHRAIVIIVAKT